MEITPIAYFRSPYNSKFGIPRQSGLVDSVRGTIELCDPYRNADALRGLDEFDYLWIVWGFSANVDAPKHPTVRPPRLGGNRHVGVFATRSSFRPNNIALSSVRIVAVSGTTVEVAGADLMDGTPIYDIKPYIVFTDSHPEARSGFVDTDAWTALNVVIPDPLRQRLTDEQASTLEQTLAQDPRPQYHDSPERVYGMTFDHLNIRFRIDGDTATVVGVY